MVRTPVPKPREGRGSPLAGGPDRIEAQSLLSGWAFLILPDSAI